MRTSIFGGSVQSRSIDALLFESRARLLHAVYTGHLLARAADDFRSISPDRTQESQSEQGCTDG